MSDPLEALRRRFVARCAEDLSRLRVLAEADLSSGELQDMAHSLSGAAGTFGFPALSDVAGGVDDTFAMGGEPTREQIKSLMNALQAVVEAA